MITFLGGIGSDIRTFIQTKAVTVRSVLTQVQREVQPIAEAVQHGFDLVDTADRVARRYRWCISSSWPFDLVLEIGRIAKTDRPATILNRRIVEFYAADDWRELEELVMSITARGAVTSWRRAFLIDGVKIIRAGDRDGFNAATYLVRGLFPELEGILRDFARNDLGLLDTKKQLVSIGAMIAPLRSVAQPIDDPGLDLIVRKLWRSSRGRPLPSGKRMTRHNQLHGLARAAPPKTEAVRLFLMIDLVTYLIDEYRLVQADDQPSMRSAYGQLLSLPAELRLRRHSRANDVAGQRKATLPEHCDGRRMPSNNDATEHVLRLTDDL